MFAARAMSRVAAPARAAVSRAAVGAPKRGMAGGAAPQYEGWEAKVREKLPKDEHVSSQKSKSTTASHEVVRGNRWGSEWGSRPGSGGAMRT